MSFRVWREKQEVAKAMLRFVAETWVSVQWGFSCSWCYSDSRQQRAKLVMLSEEEVVVLAGCG